MPELFPGHLIPRVLFKGETIHSRLCRPRIFPRSIGPCSHSAIKPTRRSGEIPHHVSIVMASGSGRRTDPHGHSTSPALRVAVSTTEGYRGSENKCDSRSPLVLRCAPSFQSIPVPPCCFPAVAAELYLKDRFICHLLLANVLELRLCADSTRTRFRQVVCNGLEYPA
jgi:hypothetical protein